MQAKITYKHRPIKGFFTGKPHRLVIEGLALSGETHVDSHALKFLQSLKRRGSMSVELAWDIWFKSHYWYTGDTLKRYNRSGFDFARKSDAMMFKMAFHGTKQLGLPVVIKEKII